MSNLSEERMKEIEETKALVKKMNVDAVSQLLTDLQDDHHNIKTEQVDLKRILTNFTQDIVELRAEINILKAMGFRSNTGTGSTVHTQGE
jgi:phage host-nuclease inhibitor protein Gam